MSHFYGNALSILNVPKELKKVAEILQPQHFEAVRMLPSFRNHVERLVNAGALQNAKALLKDNASLIFEMNRAITRRNLVITKLLRAIHVLESCSSENISKIDLYMKAMDGDLRESEVVRRMLGSIKRMTSIEVMSFTQSLTAAISDGSADMDLHGWMEIDSEFLDQVQVIETDVLKLEKQSESTGETIRSSYAIHSKGVRATVIAQKVQLSFENSKLSTLDKAFTSCVERLSELVLEYFFLENPQDLFLNEVWLYDSISPYRDVFTPRPRAVIERALSAPYDYLIGETCDSDGGLSSTHPATSILYQMYLETGSLINVFDLWSAFYEMVGSGDEQKLEERDALVLFYRALAELRSLGLVKQSKKKADHLAKVAWKGL
jgi:origin recognition complex subunit 3